MIDQPNDNPGNAEAKVPPMHTRTVAMSDGRYMVFYTFDGDSTEVNPQPLSARPDTDV